MTLTSSELKSVKEIRAKIDFETRRLESLKSCAMTTTRLDGLPHSKPQMSVPEKLAIEIAESEAKIEKLVEEMTVRAVELTNKIYETVANVTIAEVLTLRYVAGLKVEEIARRLNFTRSYIWKLHNRGLEQIDRHCTD